MERPISRIRFGPGSLTYLIVTGLIMFAALYTQANLLFWALGLMIGALVASFAVAVVSLRKIEIKRLTPPRGVADEPLVLRYHVVNRSRFACFSVELIEDWPAKSRRILPLRRSVSVAPGLKGRPHGWLLHIGPGQSIQAEAACWPRRRGALRFERIVVRSGFPFGIIRKRVTFRQAGEVLIHPPQRRLSRQAVMSLSNQESGQARHTDRGGGHDEFFGLRPYRPGDSYKLIDWKHSARSSQLVSRELAKARPLTMTVLLDLTLPKSVQEEAQVQGPDGHWRQAQEEAVNLAAALIREAHLQNVQAGLYVAGASVAWLGIANSQNHRQRLLDQLAGLDLSEVRPTGSAGMMMRSTVCVRAYALDADGQPEARARIINLSGRQKRLLESDRTREPRGVGAGLEH